ELVDRAEQMDYLADALQELPDRLRSVIVGYFLEERPMREIAEELGVTESRISQLRGEALVLLRDALARALEPHLVEPPADPAGVVARRRAAYVAAVAARHAARPAAHAAAHHAMRPAARRARSTDVEWSA